MKNNSIWNLYHTYYVVVEVYLYTSGVLKHVNWLILELLINFWNLKRSGYLAVTSHCTLFSEVNNLCLCHRPPVHAVCLNHEVVVFQPRTVTAPDLVSVSNAYTYSSLLPPHLFQPCSGYPFLPPPVPISYRPPIFHPSTPLLSLSLHLLLPPPSLPGVERPSTWTSPPAYRPPPLVLTSLPLWAAQGVPCVSLLLYYLFQFPPLCRPWPAPRSMSAPVVLTSKGPFLSLTVSITLMPAPPPVGLDQQPSTMPVPIGFRPAFFSCPLWIRLSLPVFCAVSWCLL